MADWREGDSMKANRLSAVERERDDLYYAIHRHAEFTERPRDEDKKLWEHADRIIGMRGFADA